MATTEINGEKLTFNFSSVEELFTNYPETEYVEDGLTYYSSKEYAELQSHQWFPIVRSTITSALDASEVLEACEALEDSQYFALDGAEYRVVSDEELFDVYLEEFISLNEGTFDIPAWLQVDWEASARDVIASYGYASYFSSWDGETHIEVDHYNLFRVA